MSGPKNKSNTELVLAKILDMIDAHDLGIGDNLGTEKELVLKLNASARSVREAIVKLNALGIIESRQKSGIIVCKPDIAGNLKLSVGFLGRIENGMKQLMEFRFVLEMGAIKLLAMDLQKELVDELSKCADQYDDLIQNGGSYREITDSDAMFHRNLLEATGNPMIHDLYFVVSDYFQQLLISVPDIQTVEDRHTFAREHRQIVEALRCNNVEYAAIILSGHLGRNLTGLDAFLKNNCSPGGKNA